MNAWSNTERVVEETLKLIKLLCAYCTFFC